jgi:hypothetical protein
MEAKYVALSASCKDLFPIIDVTQEICSTFGSHFGLTLRTTTDMHVKIHADNAGALLLGKLEPRRMTPRSKHYAIKYHWFREHIGPQNIELVKISSETNSVICLLRVLIAIFFNACERSSWAGNPFLLFREGV